MDSHHIIDTLYSYSTKLACERRLINRIDGMLKDLEAAERQEFVNDDVYYEFRDIQQTMLLLHPEEFPQVETATADADEEDEGPRP